ncbi:HAUS augmin-like complex subunit 4 [Lissotriton helveticus]
MTSASGEYSKILQEVCSRIPLCHLIEDDLTQYPEFTKLLLEVSQQFDESGLSLDLKKELDLAQNELMVQKKAWLQYEVVHRLLQEILQEYYSKKDEKHEGKNIPYTEEKMQLYETLSQVLLVMECTRILDPSTDPKQVMSPLLDLEKKDLLEFLPPKRDVQQMREKLQKELEARFEEKCISLLTFHQPETDKNGDLLKSMKSLQLVVNLQDEKRKLQSESEKCKANAVTLEKHKMAFPPVMLRCLSLLQTMATKFRLSAQADTNRFNVDYWEKKCEAFSIKIRLEKLKVLIDTYTPEKLEVHRIIRSSLEKAILTQEQEVMTSRMLLHPYESMGPEFELIVKEYAQLKGEIAKSKWALELLCKPCQ